jgi:hypothetical protein
VRRVFLSYHTPQRALALALKQAVEIQAPDTEVFVDNRSLRHGHWQEQLFQAVNECDAFVILVGSRLGDWQKLEYYESCRDSASLFYPSPDRHQRGGPNNMSAARAMTDTKSPPRRPTETANRKASTARAMPSR